MARLVLEDLQRGAFVAVAWQPEVDALNPRVEDSGYVIEPLA